MALWFGELLGISGAGIESLSRSWENWSTQTEPSITGEVLFFGREAAKKSFLEKLSESPPLIGVEADSAEEAVASVSYLLLEEGLADGIPPPWAAWR